MRGVIIGFAAGAVYGMSGAHPLVYGSPKTGENALIYGGFGAGAGVLIGALVCA